MPYFPDLSPCTYFPRQEARLIAIGWLDPGSEYQKGSVSEDFFNSLAALLEDPCSLLYGQGSILVLFVD